MLCSNRAVVRLVFILTLTLGGCAAHEADLSAQLTTGSLSSDPRPYEEALQSGNNHFARSDFGLAERDFRLAVENNPTNVGAWFGLAASYDRLRRFDLAGKAYGRALQLGGRTAQYLNNIGYHYLLMGDRRRATDHFKAAAEKEPANPYIRGNLALADTWSGESPQ